MKFFGEYFKHLGWQQAFNPGLLQAIQNGLGKAFDSVFAAILFLRKQFFPEYCDKSLLVAYGKSYCVPSGLNEPEEQYRIRLAKFIGFHLLAGKQIGLSKILALFGFCPQSVINIRHFCLPRWAEFGLIFEKQDISAARARELIFLVNEYKPARSLFAFVSSTPPTNCPAVYSRSHFGHSLYSDFYGITISGSETKFDFLKIYAAAVQIRKQRAPLCICIVSDVLLAACGITRYSWIRYSGYKSQVSMSEFLITTEEK